jgi:copper homeostasis protein
MPIAIEACVENLDESLAAARGGADRLELCADMSVGGTTPSADLITTVRRAVTIPIAVMIRPRGGSFVYTSAELDAMRRDIDMARNVGADVLVLGILTADGEIDAARTRELVDRAGDTPVTFHKAFDEVRDQIAALDVLIDSGVRRVLTSGGAPTALEGVDQLARLVAHASERISVMAGGTVRAHNVREIARSGVREVHARCNLDPARIRDIASALVSRP